jgi:hypothetical protein
MGARTQRSAKRRRGQKFLTRFRVGAPGVRIEDIGGEKFEKTGERVVAGGKSAP